MASYETIPIPKEDAPLQPKHKSPKFAATVAAICLASAVAGTQAPAAVMALNSYFSKGERLQLSHYRHSSRKDPVCLAVEGNSNVRQDSTNVIVWDCDDSKGKTWALDRRLSSGSYFQIRYTGETQESFDLCVVGQQPGGARDFKEGSQFYLRRCLPDDPTQQFRWTGGRHAGGRAMRWRQDSRQDSDYCLDAIGFQNGFPVQAWECSKKHLDHQIWATL